MRSRLAALIFLSSLILPARALYDASYPFYKEIKELHYQTRYKISGKPIFREDVSIHQAKEKGKDFLVTSAISRSIGGDERRTISYHLINGGRLSSYAHRIEDYKAGSLCQTIALDYDWEHRMVRYRTTSLPKGKETVKDIPLDEEFVFSRDTTILFPGLLSARAAEKRLRVMLPTGHLLLVKALFSYIPEEFMIRGKKYSCYRIELKPDFPLFSLVAPKLTFWYLASPPYYFVRYEGPLGGPFSPAVIQELSP
jgi:hypothetical protein